MDLNVRSLRWCATAVLVTAAGIGTAGSLLFASPGPVRWGVWLAAGLAVPSYWTLSWALRRSNALFFSVFFGGMVGRMAVLAGGILGVWRMDPSAATPFALSAVAALAGFSFIEVYFIGRQNRLPQ